MSLIIIIIDNIYLYPLTVGNRYENRRHAQKATETDTESKRLSETRKQTIHNRHQIGV